MARAALLASALLATVASNSLIKVYLGNAKPASPLLNGFNVDAGTSPCQAMLKSFQLLAAVRKSSTQSHRVNAQAPKTIQLVSPPLVRVELLAIPLT